jgi:hypothetical protein
VNRHLVTGCLVVGAMIFALFWTLGAHGHDHDRPELNAWFDKLASGKGLCCSIADGYAVADVDWQSSGEKYRVRIPKLQDSSEMIWMDVPPEALITEPNRVGRTMVWPLYGSDGPAIRCFMPGPMT